VRQSTPCFRGRGRSASRGGLYYNILPSRHVSRPKPRRHTAAPVVLPNSVRNPAARPHDPVRLGTCSNVLNQAPDAMAARKPRVCGDRRGCGRLLDRNGPPGHRWSFLRRCGSKRRSGWLLLAERRGTVRQILEPPSAAEPTSRFSARWLSGSGSAHPSQLSTTGSPRASRRGPRSRVDSPSTDDFCLDWPAVAWVDRFAHDDGKFRLIESIDDEPAVDSHHPLQFLTLIRTEALNSQMLPRTRLAPARPGPSWDGRPRPDWGGQPVRIVSAVGELEGEVTSTRTCTLGSGLSAGRMAQPRARSERGHPRSAHGRRAGAALYATTVRLESASKGALSQPAEGSWTSIATNAGSTAPFNGSSRATAS